MSVGIALAMVLHMTLYILSSLVLARVSGTAALALSLPLTAVRLGLPILLLARLFARARYDAVSPPAAPTKRELAAIGYACFFLIWLFGWLYGFFFQQENGFVMESPLDTVLGAILFTAFPAVLEELLVRRLIAGRIAAFNPSAAILISSLLFGLMHFSAWTFPYAFVCGLILSAVYVRTGSLPTVIAAHFCSNLLSFLLSVLDTVLKPEVMAVFFWATPLVLFLGFIPVMPRVYRVLKTPAYPRENEIAASDFLTPALVLYMAAAMAFQLIFAF